MQHWYALNTKQNLEKFVSDLLINRGINVYLPLWQPGVGKNRLSLRPYFPAYLFASVDLNQVGVSALQYTPGVRRIIMRGDEPAVLTQGEIDEIHKRVARMSDRVLDADGHPLLSGDRVEIIGGPFHGYEALFDRASTSENRVRILIDFLQKRTPCFVGLDHVHKKLV